MTVVKGGKVVIADPICGTAVHGFLEQGFCFQQLSRLVVSHGKQVTDLFIGWIKEIRPVRRADRSLQVAQILKNQP